MAMNRPARAHAGRRKSRPSVASASQAMGMMKTTPSSLVMMLRPQYQAGQQPHPGAGATSVRTGCDCDRDDADDDTGQVRLEPVGEFQVERVEGKKCHRGQACPRARQRSPDDEYRHKRHQRPNHHRQAPGDDAAAEQVVDRGQAGQESRWLGAEDLGEEAVPVAHRLQRLPVHALVPVEREQVDRREPPPQAHRQHPPPPPRPPTTARTAATAAPRRRPA